MAQAWIDNLQTPGRNDGRGNLGESEQGKEVPLFLLQVWHTEKKATENIGTINRPQGYEGTGCGRQRCFPGKF